jgi:hypothetical protein
VKRPQQTGRLHFLQPAIGATLAASDLRLQVAPTADGGQTVEVLIAWNSDPSGVTPVETCQVPLERLVSGVMVPASAIRGRTGRFTIQARIVAPEPGPWSAPTDITLAATRPYDNRPLARPPTGDDLPVRSLRRGGGGPGLTCIH